MKLPSNFNFRSLEIFVAVVRAGGMTQAAAQFDLTQSAISQTIANLETSIDTPLIDRKVRPLQLTPSGMILYDHAQKILALANKTVQDIKHPNAHAVKTLHIAMADSLTCAIGPHLVDDLPLMAQHWRISSGLTIDHEKAFAAGEIDMFMAGGELSHIGEDYRQDTIATEHFIIAAPASFQGTVDDLEELYSSYKLVRYSLRSFSGRAIEQQINRLKLKAPLWLEIDSPIAQLAMIAGGNAWGFTSPIFLLQAPQYIDKIRFFRIPRNIIPRRIMVVSRHNEFGDIPQQIAQSSQEIIRDKLLPHLEQLNPQLLDYINLEQ